MILHSDRALARSRHTTASLLVLRIARDDAAMPDASCTFCSTETAALVPTEECRVCWTCARRIARLAAHAAHAVPAGVWDAPVRGRDEEMVQLAERVAKALAPEDVHGHYELAIAYREMGLHADALQAAATAVESADDVSGATRPLRLLLTAPLLRADGQRVLRERLVRMRKN